MFCLEMFCLKFALSPHPPPPEENLALKVFLTKALRKKKARSHTAHYGAADRTGRHLWDP